MLCIIASCIFLFGFASSEKYTVILFPFTYAPDERRIFAELSIHTTNAAYTTITHGNRSIGRPAESNIRLSKEFPFISGIFTITLTETADVVMEIRELRRSYIFNIQSLNDLDREYMLISSSEISHSYTCRISSSSTTDVVVNIRVPPRLQHGLKLIGTCSRNGHCILKTDTFIEIGSRSPLYQTIIASSDKLIVFCKDDLIFQVLPKNNCGTKFQMSCPMFNSTNVNNCTVKINNVQSRRQYITINHSIHSITNFFEIPLEKRKSLNIQSGYDICVLFIENYYDDSRNSIMRTQMLSSTPTQSTLSTSETISSLVKTSESNQAHILLTTIINRVKIQDKTISTTESRSKTAENNTSANVLSINPFYSKLNSVSSQQNNNISTTSRYIDELLIDTTLPFISSGNVNSTSKDPSLRKYSTILHIIYSGFVNPTSKDPLHWRDFTTQPVLFSRNVNPISKDSLRSINATTLSIILSRYVNPSSKDLLLLRDSTTSNNYTTSAIDSRKICNCVCSNIKHTSNVTRSTTVNLHELITQLKVNKSELSSEVRKTSCAKDNRTSAQGIGYVGAVVIILVLATIVSFDLINLCQNCGHFRKHSVKQKSKKLEFQGHLDTTSA